MNSSVGQRLSAERTLRGLTVEDISRATRMTSRIVCSLEADDYSEFPNIVYTRSFLSMYADHLDVDISGFLREFHADTGPESLFPYGASESTHVVTHLRKNPDAGSPRGAPVALVTMLLVLLAAVPAVYFSARDSDDTRRSEMQSRGLVEEPAHDEAKMPSGGQLSSVDHHQVVEAGVSDTVSPIPAPVFSVASPGAGHGGSRPAFDSGPVPPALR